MNEAAPIADLAPTAGVRSIMLGATRVCLDGDHPVVELVCRELGAVTSATSVDTDAEISILVTADPIPAPPASAATLGPVTVAGDQAWLTFERAGFRVRVAPRPGGIGADIDVAMGDRPMPHRIPRSLFRWFEPSFLSPIEAQAYVFLMHVVEGAVFLFGGQTALLHASAVERSGRALALTSSGGVGKTSTAADLLSRERWRFLSDDICFVTPSGTIAHHKRRAMIYAYNLRHNPGLRQRLLAEQGAASRLQWRAFEALRISRRRRRLPAAAIYGSDRVATTAELDTVAFLVRGGTNEVRLTEADPADVARRCASIMVDEERLLVGLLRLWSAAGQPLVSVEDVVERHQTVLLAAFTRARRVVELALPADGSVVDGANAIEAVVIGKEQ